MVELVSKIVKGKHKLFENVRYKSIKVEGSEYETFYSDPSFFGNAFNILFDYTLYQKEYIENFEPNLYHKDDRTSDLMKSVFAKIQNRSNLLVRDLLYFTREERLYRTGVEIPYDYKKEEKNLELDFDFLQNKVLYTIEQLQITQPIIQSPSFSNKELGVKGDGDLIIGDILYEIKCVKEEKIIGRTQKQLQLYYLLNEYNKESSNKSYKITRFGYINPLRKQFYVWNVDIHQDLLVNWKEFIHS